MTHTTRVTRLHVIPEAEPIFDERGFSVEIADEGGGEFVVVSDFAEKIRIDAKEWPALREAIDRMVKECRE